VNYYIALIVTLAFIHQIFMKRRIMATVADVEAKIDQLNEVITAETAQQRAAIQNLKDEIANGADPASLTRIADELDASIARVQGIVPDAPEPAPEPEPTT